MGKHGDHRTASGEGVGDLGLKGVGMKCGAGVGHSWGFREAFGD
jgi:hypothetical protein